MFEPEPGKRIHERYRLERKLGEGGMGSVWAAHDEKLRRDVACKLVTERIHDSEKALARFEREAMSIARLRSPHIAQVYDYGVEDGSPFIIMELLEGEDLKGALARQERLAIDATARIVLQVAKALHAAHAAGIVHRDLKPANVFLAVEQGELVCKVFDFGVAKALNDLGDDSDTTAEGVLLGTPRYMSPEQAQGAAHVDHRADLWSLGVMAYQCLTGSLPFAAPGTGHVLVKICTEEPPKPSSLQAELGADVDAFMVRALAKDPAARFQSAREMALAFAELLDVSLSAAGLSVPTPSWEGISKSDVSLDGVSASLRPPVTLPPASSPPASEGDGTLGAATTSTDPPWSRRRSTWAAGAVVALALVGGAVGLALREPAVEPIAPVVAPAASPAITTSPVVDASPPVSAAVVSAEPIASASASPRAAARPRGPAPNPAPSAAPQPAPAPAPPPKRGDGLDLFDKRF
jgi:eukaryotic-like serine/threonine-protein kinase